MCEAHFVGVPRVMPSPGNILISGVLRSFLVQCWSETLARVGQTAALALAEYQRVDLLRYHVHKNSAFQKKSFSSIRSLVSRNINKTALQVST